MTWESQGPAAPQDPRWQGGEPPPPGPYPPPGQYPQPPGQYPQPPGQYPQPPGQYPPPPGGQYPPQGGPWAPPADPWAAPPPPDFGQAGGGWQPAPSPWQPPPAYPLAPDAYPVNISYDRAARINRLWGIPVIGVLVRAILVIPHVLVLWLMALVVGFLLLFTWIPVLLLGRFPGWGYHWIGGYLGWLARVGAYVWLLTPTYPPFSRSGGDHPVRVRYDEGVRINRLWGIPVLGLLVRAILLIPHFVILWLLFLLAAVLVVFSWVPVLILGRQADLVYRIVGGATRWWLRVYSYLLMMVDRYPPFSLGEDDPTL
jgi:hypothetical protein